MWRILALPGSLTFIYTQFSAKLQTVQDHLYVENSPQANLAMPASSMARSGSSSSCPILPSCLSQHPLLYRYQNSTVLQGPAQITLLLGRSACLGQLKSTVPSLNSSSLSVLTLALPVSLPLKRLHVSAAQLPGSFQDGDSLLQLLPSPEHSGHRSSLGADLAQGAWYLCLL